MSIIGSTITTTTPAVQVTTYNPVLSYFSIVNELGITVFKVESLYYAAGSIAQFSNPLQYRLFDINGNISSVLAVTPISPSQFQPSLYLPMGGVDDMILNGQTGILFNLNALETIQFIFYAKRKQNQNAIDDAGYINNFKAMQKAMNDGTFFDYATKNAEGFGDAGPQQSLIFTVQNTTTTQIPVNFLQQNSQEGLINATTRYEWDLTGLLQTGFFGPLTIQVKSNASQPFQIYTGKYAVLHYPPGSNDWAAYVATGLNQLGIGTFWSEAQKVVSFDSINIFGQLDLPFLN